MREKTVLIVGTLVLLAATLWGLMVVVLLGLLAVLGRAL